MSAIFGNSYYLRLNSNHFPLRNLRISGDNLADASIQPVDESTNYKASFWVSMSDSSALYLVSRSNTAKTSSVEFLLAQVAQIELWDVLTASLLVMGDTL